MNHISKIILSIIAITFGSWANAQEYPNKSIRIVLPFATGGIVDPMTRTVSQKVGENIGQPFVIEHRPGSGGIIAANYAKTLPADGYNLFLGSAGTHAANKAMNPKLPYDPIKDFVPIIIIGSVASILVVPAGSPVKTIGELVALGKTKTGGLSNATPGIGTPSHIISEIFSSRTGMPITQVHYNAAPQAMQDALGGRVDMYFASTLTTAPQIREGKLRSIAIGSRERSKLLPDVPTMAEVGLPEVELDFWFGLMGPAGIPQPIVRRLYDEFAKALRTPEVMGTLNKMELAPPLFTQEQFVKILANDIDRFARVIKEVGASAN
ncbi:MAG: Bug family tripartite tricarboxylate transporter substrate binding protein [Burkholderiales bacterium]